MIVSIVRVFFCWLHWLLWMCMWWNDKYVSATLKLNDEVRFVGLTKPFIFGRIDALCMCDRTRKLFLCLPQANNFFLLHRKNDEKKERTNKWNQERKREKTLWKNCSNLKVDSCHFMLSVAIFSSIPLHGQRINCGALSTPHRMDTSTQKTMFN